MQKKKDYLGSNIGSGIVIYWLTLFNFKPGLCMDKNQGCGMTFLQGGFLFLNLRGIFKIFPFMGYTVYIILPPIPYTW